MRAGFLNRPVACHIRFFGIGLESTTVNFTAGGTGYLTVKYARRKDQPLSPYNNPAEAHGFEFNETVKVYCYYHTAKSYGSEFLDTPKTLGE
jgi:hypothetical protein